MMSACLRMMRAVHVWAADVRDKTKPSVKNYTQFVGRANIYSTGPRRNFPERIRFSLRSVVRWRQYHYTPDLVQKKKKIFMRIPNLTSTFFFSIKSNTKMSESDSIQKAKECNTQLVWPLNTSQLNHTQANAYPFDFSHIKPLNAIWFLRKPSKWHIRM